jgi:lipid-binding SYLF domain-containing protein
MKKLIALATIGALAACAPTKNDTTTQDGADNEVTAKADAGHGDEMTIDQKVMAALEDCKKIEQSCASDKNVGYFVFPDVTTVALGVGGGGGKGALVRNGKIDGYYSLGEGSIGLQAGATEASYVVGVNDKASLDKYVKDGQWSIGSGAGLTVAKADANAQGDVADGQSTLYVFNAEGLMADVKVNAMKISKSDDTIATGGAIATSTATGTKTM